MAKKAYTSPSWCRISDGNATIFQELLSNRKIACMYSFLFSLISAIVLFAGCKKNNNNIPTVTGSWKLITFTEGFSGRVIKVPSDSLIVLNLKRDNSYNRASKGIIYESGTYNIASIKTIFDATKNLPAILFKDGSGDDIGHIPQVVQTRNDTLILSLNVYDGNGYIYVKLK